MSTTSSRVCWMFGEVCVDSTRKSFMRLFFQNRKKKLSPTPCDKACRGCTHTIPAHAIYAPQLLEPKTRRPGDKVRARLRRGWKSTARRDMAEAKLFFDEFRKFELQPSAFSSPPDHNFGLMIGLCMCMVLCVGAADRKSERECMRRSRVIKCSAEESIIQHAIILHRHLCWLYLCETTWASLFRTTPARCDPFICTRLVLLLYRYTQRNSVTHHIIILTGLLQLYGAANFKLCHQHHIYTHGVFQKSVFLLHSRAAWKLYQK